MKLFMTIIIMGLILLAVTFSQQNNEMVTLRYYGFIDPNFRVASYLLILSSFFAGIIVAGLFGLIERFRIVMKVSKLKREIKTLENDLYECRKKVLTEGPTSSAPLNDQNLL